MILFTNLYETYIKDYLTQTRFETQVARVISKPKSIKENAASALFLEEVSI